jgi:hypothetical protein
MPIEVLKEIPYERTKDALENADEVTFRKLI